MSKRNTKNKSPYFRLVLVIVFASLLASAGFYAYIKRNEARGLTIQDTFAEWKQWFLARKKQWHEGMQAVARQGADVKPEEKIKFEFYESLASTQVKVPAQDLIEDKQQVAASAASETAKQAGGVTKSLQAKKSPAKKNSIVNPDEFEKAFYAHMKSRQKL